MQGGVFSIENEVGRLLLCRIRSPIEASDVKGFADRLRAVLGGIDTKVVICVDLRAANVFPPDVAEGFIAIMRSDNAKVERSGFLVGASALFSLQVERLIRDGQNPARRAFHEAASLREWLGEALTPMEKRCLEAFVEPLPGDAAGPGP